MLSAASGTASSSTTGLNRISLSPKLSTGSDKIQGSIERLAVKWEAKRKNLVSGGGGEDSDANGSATTSLNDAASKLGQRPAATDMGGHNRRAAIMEQRLQSIKQQGISTSSPTVKAQLPTPGPSVSGPRSMMAPSTSKRLSISDQMGLAVGRRPMIPRQQLKTGGGGGHSSDASLLAFSASSGSDEDDERRAKSSSDELDLGRNNRSSDEELPPYPAVGLGQTPVLRPRLPMPPPPAPDVATAMEDMVTYVPPPPHPAPTTCHSTSASTSSSTAVMYPSSTSSSLIVKPITLSTSPPSSSSVLAQRPSPESAKGFPRHRRTLPGGQQSRLLPPRSLPQVHRQSVQQQSHLHSPPSPPSPAPAASPTAAAAAASSIARPRQHLAQSSSGQQHHFGIKSSYVQHYNRSPPSSLQHQQHPPPPPPPPPLRHPPSTANPSVSPQGRMDYSNGLSPPPPPMVNGDGGRSRSGGGLIEGGGRGDNADAGNNEGNTFAFARRLPSPRYRQQQPQQPLPRRPLSHQEQQWQHRQRARPPLPNGGKSLSVENILDEGEASEGSPLSPDHPNLNGHLQYHPNFAHQARGMRNRDSVSLTQVSKRTISNGTAEGRGRSSSPQKLVSASEEIDGDRDYHHRSTSSGNQRRPSSGLRMMWQGAPQVQSQQRSGSRFSGQSGGQASSSSSSAAPPHLRLGRASSVESAASKLNDKSRSPSPGGVGGEGNLSPRKSQVGGSGVQSRLRKPLSTSSLPSAHHRAQQQGMYQQNQQRNSFGSGGGGGDHFNRVHPRAKSASNSPGASRTSSPPSNASAQLQQQTQVPRRSAYLGQPPPPPRQGYGQQVPQRQQQVRSGGFGYHQQHQHRSQPHLPSSSPSSPHHQANTDGRPASGGGGGAGGRNLYSYQQHQTPYQGRPSQMPQPSATNAATSHLRVPNGGRTNVLVGVGGVGGPAAGRHSSVGLPMPGFSSGSRSGQRTM